MMKIDGALCLVAYATFEEAIVKIKACCQGALLAKADIKSAFRLLPISPSAFSSLGFYFDNCFFFDKCLTIGCSLSCTYFFPLSCSRSFECGQDSVVQYLGDFLFVGPADSNIFSRLLQLFEAIAEDFGVPLAAEKTSLPAMSVEFLGIQFDTESREFRPPQGKIEKMSNLIASFLRQRKVERDAVPVGLLGHRLQNYASWQDFF